MSLHVPALSYTRYFYRWDVFHGGHSVALRDVLDFSLTLPGLAHGADVLVTGRVRVVRVIQNSELASGSVGIAVVTEEYHILEPEAAA